MELTEAGSSVTPWLDVLCHRLSRIFTAISLIHPDFRAERRPRIETRANGLSRFPTYLILLDSPEMVATLMQLSSAARSSLRIARPCSRALSTPSSLPPLVGTAPEYQRHLMLHCNQEVRDFPSHLESTSKLYKELGKRFSKHPVLSKSGFGVSDAGTRQQGEKPENWDSSRPRFEEPVEGKEEER